MGPTKPRGHARRWLAHRSSTGRRWSVAAPPPAACAGARFGRRPASSLRLAARRQDQISGSEFGPNSGSRPARVAPRPAPPLAKLPSHPARTATEPRLAASVGERGTERGAGPGEAHVPKGRREGVARALLRARLSGRSARADGGWRNPSGCGCRPDVSPQRPPARGRAGSTHHGPPAGSMDAPWVPARSGWWLVAPQPANRGCFHRQRPPTPTTWLSDEAKGAARFGTPRTSGWLGPLAHTHTRTRTPLRLGMRPQPLLGRSGEHTTDGTRLSLAFARSAWLRPAPSQSLGLRSLGRCAWAAHAQRGRREGARAAPLHADAQGA